MTRILVAGVAVADFLFYVDDFPDAALKYRANDAKIVGGGGAANAAVAIARLGGEAWLAARLGDDPVGGIIAAGLCAEGVDLSLTEVSAGVSSYSSILIDRRGERQIINFRGRDLSSRTDHLIGAPEIGAALGDTRWSEGATAAMELARARNVSGILDIEADSDTTALAAASHLAFSEPGLAALYPGLSPDLALERAIEEYGGWVCVTLGADGVLFFGQDGPGHVPAFAVQAVDTLGAGDVWHGAFALLLGEGWDEVTAIRFANAAAAVKCGHRGGREGAPTRAQVEALLARS